MALDWPAINRWLASIVKNKAELLERKKPCTPDEEDVLLKAYRELEDEQDAIIALVIREGLEPYERPYLH